jgi:hypothetical protein
MSDLEIFAQLARCRRLLSATTDHELRERMMAYARELEAQIGETPPLESVTYAKRTVSRA